VKGLIVLKQYEHNITFDLNESLSFKRGQEIAEMVSISLDPDIVIQSYDDYIQVRGVILLSGEYRRRESEEQKEPQVKSNRYIEKLMHVKDDLASFYHRFPVEISVTKERVDNMDDVVVTVDSFDYEIPSTDTLNIFASLHIYGIKPEENEQGVLHMNAEEREGVKKEDLDEKNLTQQIEDSHPISTDKQTAVKEEANRPREDNRSLKLVHDQSESKEEQEVLEEIDNRLVLDDQAREVLKHSDESSDHSVMNQDQAHEQEMLIELTEAKEEDDEDVKDVTFLTELFEEEEEMYTQVTIYIVQEEDSVEAIAKRYELPVLQLLKENDLSGDTLEAGQLLTIRRRATNNDGSASQ